MKSLIDFLQAPPLLLTLLFFVAVLAILVFLIIQIFTNRKSQAKMLQAMHEAQKDFHKEGSELLANQLSVYAEKDLLIQVQKSYEHLISQDLVPSISGAGKALNELSAELISRQESTMQELAHEFADFFAKRVEDHCQQQAEIVNSMNDSASLFSESIASSAKIAGGLFEQYDDVYQKAAKVSDALLMGIDRLGEQLSNLDDTFEMNKEVALQSQGDMQKSAKMFVIAAKTVESMEQAVAQAVENVSKQQEFTADVLQKAVEDMSNNTQDVATQVLAEFGSSLNASNEVMNETVAALQGVTDKIHKTTEGFATEVAAAYSNFDGSVDEKITKITERFTDSAKSLSEEMQGSSEKFSVAVADAYSNFDGSVDEKMSIITEKFSNSASKLTEGMHVIAENMVVGISRAYETFNRSVDEKMTEVQANVANSYENEYDKIIDAAKTHSETFTTDISSFNESFARHIDSLQVVTSQLNNTVASFKADSDASAQKFETGIDKLVTTALKEMDSSLAEIVGRLATVAESIAEAADALPRAVRSIKESK